MGLLIKIISLMVLLQLSQQNDIKGFDDTIAFDIEWPGKLSEDFDYSNSETIEVTSSMNEKYKCIIPNLIEKETSLEEPYTGPGPLELLSPLFSSKTCSFRLESYWDYEVCHGRFIRQYHEEREGKIVKVQEYFLGKWDEKHMERLLEHSKETREDLKDSEKVPTKKIENVNMPYFEITMDNGTACDLNNYKPRMTKVLYFCHTQGKHEVYSVKEISTCIYELIILTPLLCNHPKYKPIDTGELKIHCLPLDGALDRPYNLMKLRQESSQLRRNFDLEGLKVELINFDKDTTPATKMIDKDTTSSPSNRILDTSPVENFLKGKHCLYGGTGWWKFEFCYGKQIEQYHLEKDGSRTSINLGKFNKEKHLEWIKNHPQKRPKPVDQRTQLSHFYSDGDVCDKTGKHRQTEVKLKCLKSPANPSSVSLYLLEPKFCEYILGVESPIICDILSKADEDGLVEIDNGIDQEMIITVKL